MGPGSSSFLPAPSLGPLPLSWGVLSSPRPGGRAQVVAGGGGAAAWEAGFSLGFKAPHRRP